MSWIEQDGCLVREFRTPDFMTAFRIVTSVVEPAEEMNHHPDILFGWGRVRITLTTHDAGGITEKDHQLARLIDEAVLRLDL
ncbi:4a-hydroxytetrahydrobiopterin dehydratase [Geothrix paludis]|uniref:4a-hydroxytetrahydrobiopterin dehydratase n=1 Tax=Geothrix paludis TaxID=2922722 RepID=UPI001FADB515